MPQREHLTVDLVQQFQRHVQLLLLLLTLRRPTGSRVVPDQTADN